MDIYERAVDAGAAALVKGGVVCDPVTGDVLHDHDWTPMEAARAVLDAVNHRGAVEALREWLDADDDAERDYTDESEARLSAAVARARSIVGGQYEASPAHPRKEHSDD